MRLLRYLYSVVDIKSFQGFSRCWIIWTLFWSLNSLHSALFRLTLPNATCSRIPSVKWFEYLNCGSKLRKHSGFHYLKKRGSLYDALDDAILNIDQHFHTHTGKMLARKFRHSTYLATRWDMYGNQYYHWKRYLHLWIFHKFVRNNSSRAQGPRNTLIASKKSKAESP